MPVTPQEDELKAAIVELKASNPSSGISKIHALVLATYPDWAVSEKRTRKILQAEGLIVASSPAGDVQDAHIVYPSSRVIPELNVSKWTPKVKVKYFDRKKGKGLVAAEEISEGETIWKEDPFVIAPEWCVAFRSHLLVGRPALFSR